MSISLIEDSLELLDADFDGLNKNTNQKKSSNNEERKSIFKGKKVVCAVEEYRKTHIKKDRTKKALKLLSRIDKAAGNKKYLKQAKEIQKELEREKNLSKAKPVESSVFSEADFNRIQTFRVREDKSLLDDNVL